MCSFFSNLLTVSVFCSQRAFLSNLESLLSQVSASPGLPQDSAITVSTELLWWEGPRAAGPVQPSLETRLRTQLNSLSCATQLHSDQTLFRSQQFHGF